MTVQKYTFGKIVIDEKVYEKDLVIDKGEIKKRKKKASKHLKSEFGHTPLTAHENIPWNCNTLVIGTGKTENLPITDDVYQEAEKRNVAVVTKPTEEAIQLLGQSDTDLILRFIRSASLL